MEWMILPLRRYAQFTGRSRRKEYWMFFLFQTIVNAALSVLDATLGLGGHVGQTTSVGPAGFSTYAGMSGGILSDIFTLAILVPNISVGVRRLHDTNHSGWWLLLLVMPFGAFFAIAAGAARASGGALVLVGILASLVLAIGAIVLLVWYCTAGTVGPNRFGEDPKGDIPADLAATFE